MTVERADLSASLSLERLAPAQSASTVQGQSSPEQREGKPRRRPPPAEASPESSPESSPEESDLPRHRIDSMV